MLIPGGNFANERSRCPHGLGYRQDQEGLLHADIDLGMIGVAKNAADPAGHYSRPDITRLLFNNKPSRRVEHFSLPIDTEAAVEVAVAK